MVQRKGKSTNAADRTIEQYCSVCKKSYRMPVVEEAENQEVIWLKCPGCKGFLPFMLHDRPDTDSPGGEPSTDDRVETDDLAIEDIDKDRAREYQESDLYDVGDIIFHRSWNDYGKVISKEQLPGNRNTIIVRFVNQGTIRLLEGVG